LSCAGQIYMTYSLLYMYIESPEGSECCRVFLICAISAMSFYWQSRKGLSIQTNRGLAHLIVSQTDKLFTASTSVRG
jgi:hypothetical protein